MLYDPVVVREITRLEQAGNRQLHGKTGWQNAPGPGIGRWVGWVEEGGRVHAFALNIDIHTPAEAKQRVELGKAGLRALGGVVRGWLVGRSSCWG